MHFSASPVKINNFESSSTSVLIFFYPGAMIRRYKEQVRLGAAPPFINLAEETV
jgi:hypothetical protein